MKAYLAGAIVPRPFLFRLRHNAKKHAKPLTSSVIVSDFIRCIQTSSVARRVWGGYSLPLWLIEQNAEQGKYHVFSTFESAFALKWI